MRRPWIPYGILLGIASIVPVMIDGMIWSEKGPSFASAHPAVQPFLFWAFLLTGIAAVALTGWGLVDKFVVHRHRRAVRCPRILLANFLLACVVALPMALVATDSCSRKRQRSAPATIHGRSHCPQESLNGATIMA